MKALTVICRNGTTRRVDAPSSVGGLAVHRVMGFSDCLFSEKFHDDGRCWSITHAASGLGVIAHVHTKVRACAVRRELLGLAQWTEPAEAFKGRKTLAQAVARIRRREAARAKAAATP